MKYLMAMYYKNQILYFTKDGLCAAKKQCRDHFAVKEHFDF